MLMFLIKNIADVSKSNPFMRSIILEVVSFVQNFLSVVIL